MKTYTLTINCEWLIKTGEFVNRCLWVAAFAVCFILAFPYLMWFSNEDSE